MNVTLMTPSGIPPGVAEVLPLLYLGISPFISLFLTILAYYRVQ